MTQPMTKEDALVLVLEAITACTVPGADTSAAIIITNHKTDTVNVYGVNVEQSDLAEVLTDAAQHVTFLHRHDYANRTIN